MPNDYFQHDKHNVPAGTRPISSQINSIADQVEAALDKMPSEVEMNEDRGAYGVDQAVPAPSAGYTPYTITISNVVTYTDGMTVSFEAAAASAGPSTLNVNGLGAKQIINPDGTSMVAGSLPLGSKHRVQYDVGTDAFVLISGSNIGWSGPRLSVKAGGVLVSSNVQSITIVSSDAILTTVDAAIEVDIPDGLAVTAYSYATPGGAAAHMDNTSGSFGRCYGTSPDTSTYVAGSFDIQANLTKVDWAETGSNTIWQRGSAAVNALGIAFYLHTGNLKLTITSDGIGDSVTATSSAAVPFIANAKGWVRATWDQSTETANFYTSADDRATWDLLGTADLALSISGNDIYDDVNIAAPQVGSEVTGGNKITAKIHRVICLDGIDGNPSTTAVRRASDFNPKGQAGNSSWTGVTDEVWNTDLTTIVAD